MRWPGGILSAVASPDPYSGSYDFSDPQSTEMELASLRSFPLSQCPHTFLEVRRVVIEVVRAVGAIGIPDIVKVISLRGIKGGVDRTLAGISHRTRRQSGIDVRVVRR